MKDVLVRLLLICFRVFPVKHNRIFFISYYGQQYGCNPKYISEFIRKKDKEGRFELIWGFTRSMNEVPVHPKIKKVKLFSLSAIYAIATSKIIITNYRMPTYFVKRENQYYIQTWHSSLRLKQVEQDAEEFLPAGYLKMARRDSNHTDLILSGSQFSSETIKRAFWYEGEIFEHGMPRNDLLLSRQNTKKKETMLRLGLSEGQKVVLYAPTFRKELSPEIYALDFLRLKYALKKRYSGEWVVLARLHPHLLPFSSSILGEYQVKDVTAYPDIQELLNISDFLITDYSSLMFDYMVTKKPCFLFVPDAEQYQLKERSLYFKLDQLPFPAAGDMRHLLIQIDQFDDQLYQKKIKDFTTSIGSFDEGIANEKLYERIEKICFESKRRELDEAV